jgi:uncharacterized membrane protein YdjX (TVP38/TMEM64 family)
VRRWAYGLLAASVVVLLLISFVVVEALEIPLLVDPVPALRGAGPFAALIGLALLTVDVAIPVPASLVMTAHGALFGVPVGAALSVVGGTAATLVALLLGRRGERVISRVTLPRHRQTAERLVTRYGAAAIAVTRPVPVLAEAVAVVAGAAGMPVRQAAWAGALGNLVPAAAYAVVGATATDVATGVAVFGGVLLVSLAAWLVPVLHSRIRTRS